MDLYSQCCFYVYILKNIKFKFVHENCKVKQTKKNLHKYYHPSSSLHHLKYMQVHCSAESQKNSTKGQLGKNTRVLCWSIVLLVYGVQYIFCIMSRTLYSAAATTPHFPGRQLYFLRVLCWSIFFLVYDVQYIFCIVSGTVPCSCLELLPMCQACRYCLSIAGLQPPE